MHDIDDRLAERALEIDALVLQESELQSRLEAQRDAVAALLRSAFALGRHAELRLLFAPEDMAEVGRLLAYHRYLQRDRTTRIKALGADLAALADARKALEAARAALAADRAARETELAALAAGRAPARTRHRRARRRAGRPGRAPRRAGQGRARRCRP